MLFGTVVLTGWAAGIAPLTHVRAEWPAMTVETAVMNILAGTALIVLSRPRGRWGKGFGTAAALLVFAFAASTLAEYAFGRNAEIDRLLGHTGGVWAQFPGRSSPQTALAFLFLAPALILLDREPRRALRVSDVLCLVGLSMPILALLGYLYGISGLYALLPYTGMAIHAGGALVLLGVGILSARADSGLISVLTSPYAGGVAARRMLFAMLVLPFACWLVVRGMHAHWYPAPVGTALVVFLALLDLLVLLVATSAPLNAKDAALRQALTASRAAEQALAQAHDIERQLRADLEEVTRASVALTEAVAALPQTNLGAVLRTLALQAQRLVSADYVGIGVGSDGQRPSESWIFVDGTGAQQAQLPGEHPPPRAVLEVVAREGRLMRVRDVRHHPAFASLPAHDPPMAALLALPLCHQGRPVGYLYLARRPGRVEFSEQSERVMCMLAARAAAAIETATLYLREALQRAWLQATIDQMPGPVIVLDERGEVALQNRPAQALASQGGHLDALGGPSAPDIRVPSGQPVPADALPHVRALRSGDSVLDQELVIMAGERSMPVIASATPVRIDSRVAGAVAVFQDITAIKELERQREEWISVVAHDLRAPISAIALTAESLARGAVLDDARRHQGIRRIQAAADRLARMIHDLLDASRLEANQLSIERRPVNLRALLEEMPHTMSELSGHAIHMSFPDAVPWISGDHMRIDQIFRNLLSNAGKYASPDSPVDVVVEARDRSFEVMIRNRGLGIPAEQRATLFQRFGASPATKRSGAPGIGLGLYISKGLVQAHGGRIWAESTPGATTIFHVLLPALEARGAAQTQGNAPELS